MKRIHRKMNDLLRQQLIVQEKRIMNCALYGVVFYYFEKKDIERNEGSFYSKRFKTKN